MTLIADVLLAASAFGAGFYCFILARRLNNFTKLENGMGGAVAVLSAQVDDLTEVMRAAQSSAEAQTLRLDQINSRADAAAIRLELLMSSLHDLPDVEASRAEHGERRGRQIRIRRLANAEAAE